MTAAVFSVAAGVGQPNTQGHEAPGRRRPTPKRLEVSEFATWIEAPQTRGVCLADVEWHSAMCRDPTCLSHDVTHPDGWPDGQYAEHADWEARAAAGRLGRGRPTPTSSENEPLIWLDKIDMQPAIPGTMNSPMANDSQEHALAMDS